MPDSAVARCHCGGVELVATFPSRFCAHCYCGSCRTTHAAPALFVTPVDRAPDENSFTEERPEWAPFHAFP